MVALNILVFTFFEIRFWPVSAYRDLFISGFVVALVVLVAMVGLAVLAGFKERSLMVLQLQLIGSALILAFGLSVYMLAIVAVWITTAVGKLILNWHKIFYDKFVIVAESALAILALVGSICGRESQTLTVASIASALGALLVLMLYDLIFRTIRKAAQIEPSPDSAIDPELIQ